ncbi:uncharacterized protein AMSG_03520 [Thecamonas trahens ATCC 50062]|uniref:Uncharacterized protein n=1 Tax=Thecamonas trahens ATCC 50062 TaxID=461836 RepID=A0A0L0D461_THETB|nr:hypothetical protein AMSG_03520 [Thecamonas trahens ATCC 50062]KNC47094.1 hypothetical protein AMSG_03520 [Thecamonas trahens ATCC 50062]|eukprot:XP_013759872.1 hypothetical protein AMSG_03520 [Thecamonas trahens ATCC 50062]
MKKRKSLAGSSRPESGEGESESGSSDEAPALASVAHLEPRQHAVVRRATHIGAPAEDDDDDDDDTAGGPSRRLDASVDVSRNGIVQVMLDDVEYALDGLATVCGSASMQIDALQHVLRTLDDPDQRLLLRAHGMLPRVLEALVALAPQSSAAALVRLQVVDALVGDGLSLNMLESRPAAALLLDALREWAAAAKPSDSLRELALRAVALLKLATQRNKAMKTLLRELGIFELLATVLDGLELESPLLVPLYELLNNLTHDAPVNAAYVLAGASHAQQTAAHAQRTELLGARESVLNSAVLLMQLDEEQAAAAAARKPAYVAPVEETLDSASLAALLLRKLESARCDEMLRSARGATAVCGVLNILVNVTNENATGAALIGCRLGELVWMIEPATLHLFINLLERSGPNRRVARQSGLLARALDVYLRTPPFDLATGLAGSAAEADVVRAYAGLLIGCALRDEPASLAQVTAAVPLAHIIATLEAFIAFQVNVGVHTSEAHTAFNEVISILRYFDA